MYTLKVKGHFSSAHNLRGYTGKCEELHGHNWHVELMVSSGDLDGLGMVADFTELKDALNRVLALLDHRYLNEMDSFKEVNPTSENLARYIYEKVDGMLPKLNVSSVTVWETDSASATYSK
jgi:6-pyruvoyltetrahydropterin/6-carboxytetrahydropterin synthase